MTRTVLALILAVTMVSTTALADVLLIEEVLVLFPVHQLLFLKTVDCLNYSPVLYEVFDFLAKFARAGQLNLPAFLQSFLIVVGRNSCYFLISAFKVSSIPFVIFPMILSTCSSFMVFSSSRKVKFMAIDCLFFPNFSLLKISKSL